MQRLRVLISAHEFSPEQGSECAIGWNIATVMAGYHEVTVLCADGPALNADSYRHAVSRYLERQGAIPGLRVVFVGQPPGTLRWARLNRKLMALSGGVGWQPLYYLGLNGWHRAALRKARELGLDNFDLVHQLTPLSFLRPGFLWKTGLPFFWGPLGGMYRVPPSFSRSGGLGSLLFETVRCCNIAWQVGTSRALRRAVSKARRIWTITGDELRTVNGFGGKKAFPMIDTAPPPGITGRVRRYDGKRPLEICWSGRHESRKALPLLLRAISRLPEPSRISLTVLGAGPETANWQTLAHCLGLEKVRWRGQLPYDEALQAIGEGDVFVLSSFREAASMVVLEALGWGLPVVCHDACGMGLAVDGSCGIKVPFQSPETSVEGFRAALERLLDNPELVEQLSQGALRRAALLSWDAKVEEIALAYLEVAGEPGPLG